MLVLGSFVNDEMNDRKTINKWSSILVQLVSLLAFIVLLCEEYSRTKVRRNEEAWHVKL